MFSDFGGGIFVRGPHEDDVNGEDLMNCQCL